MDYGVRPMEVIIDTDWDLQVQTTKARTSEKQKQALTAEQSQMTRPCLFADAIAQQNKHEREKFYSAVKYAACFHDRVEHYDEVQVVEDEEQVKRTWMFEEKKKAPHG